MKVTKAAIIGLEHKVIWAGSTDFQLSENEINALIAAFTDKGVEQTGLEIAGVEQTGLEIAGAKYHTIQADAKSIQLKKGVDGVCMFKTIQTVILGTYISPIQHAECFGIVWNLAKYLEGKGF